MNYTFAEGDSRVTLNGRLTFPDHPAFRALTSRLLGSEGHPLALELHELEFIDSAGLGMFLIARDEALRMQRTLILRSPRGQVKRMFELSKFDTLFAIEF
jgi:HptB-dependent secretion and biofilm anti anti-sigma factor